MSKLSQKYQRTMIELRTEQVALEAMADKAALDEVREDLENGQLSDQTLAIDAAREAGATQLTTVATSMADARELEDDAREFRAVQQNTSVVREAMDAVNDAGGFTMESFHYATLALKAALAPCRIDPPVVVPSVESFADGGKVVISLESIDSMIADISAVKGDVQSKSVDGILRVLESLKMAIPEVKDRMQAMRQALPYVTYDETVEIRVDDLVFKSLEVEGRLPTGFRDFFTGYGLFANRILSAFGENALGAASKAGEAGKTIGALAEGACPIEALCAMLKDIGDPRDSIDADQLCFILPGSGSLFGSPSTTNAMSDAVDEVNDEATAMGNSEVDGVPVNDSDGDGDAAMMEVKARLTAFVDNRVPLDPLGWTDRPVPEGENPSIRVLSKDSIDAVLAELIKVMEIVDIKTYGESHRQTWTQARSAFSGYQAAKNNLQAVQVAALRPLDEDVCNYFDTVFELSAWPTLHLLVNLVFTANFFLLLAERSIAGKTEEAPEEAKPDSDDEPEMTDPEMDVDPVADIDSQETDVDVPSLDETVAEPTTDDVEVSGGDSESDDAIAATQADANNDALADESILPDSDEEEEEEEEEDDAAV